MSVARSMLGVLGISIVAWTVGCGGADPTGQGNAAAQAGPNDMPTGDPPESDDPSSEEGTGGTCEADPVASLGDGWTKHTNGAFSFQAPSNWKTTIEFSANTDASVSPYYAETDVEFKVATGTGYFARMRELLAGDTPEAGLAEMEAFPSTIGTTGTTCTVSSPALGTYACDPMASSMMVCRHRRGVGTVYQRYVYQDGHRFEIFCSGSNMPDTTSLCAKVLDSVEITK